MSTFLNIDTLRFQLFCAHKIVEILDIDRFSDYDKESISQILDAVNSFADKELHPIFREMDEQGSHFDDGVVVTHPRLGHIIKQAAELGLIGSNFSYDDGGMQLPNIVSTAVSFIIDSANNNIAGYTGLTTGAAELILEFGSQVLKDTYLPNMLNGNWCGTMCLTEPQAGSSLSDITTTAYPNDDGSFKIRGQKIFISGGDHEHADNFVHLLLARIEGAPSGTKGISLFVVPKYLPTSDGLSDNDVKTIGDFQKMGQRGYCTTHLVFGESDNTTAFLVGEPHQGLKYMFLMMNGARIAVGRGAVGIAGAAYHASLQYAKERPQGRRLPNTNQKNTTTEQSLIIEHADVRRMLFLQKAIYEGSLSLVLQAAYYWDMSLYGPEEKRDDYRLLLEILTPIAKTYPAEKGRQAVDTGLQVLGGYGFCNDFVLQQYYRDIRIFSIYEGTTGIQSQDLLGRKITMHNGKALELLAAEVQHTIAIAMEHPALVPYARLLTKYVLLAQRVLGHLLPFAAKGQYERFLSDATIFMEFFGTLTVAWQWLKLGITTRDCQNNEEAAFKDEFLDSTFQTMRFYFTYELPRMKGMASILQNNNELTILKENDYFNY